MFEVQSLIHLEFFHSQFEIVLADARELLDATFNEEAFEAFHCGIDQRPEIALVSNLAHNTRLGRQRIFELHFQLVTPPFQNLDVSLQSLHLERLFLHGTLDGPFDGNLGMESVALKELELIEKLREEVRNVALGIQWVR